MSHLFIVGTKMNLLAIAKDIWKEQSEPREDSFYEIYESLKTEVLGIPKVIDKQ